MIQGFSRVLLVPSETLSPPVSPRVVPPDYQWVSEGYPRKPADNVGLRMHHENKESAVDAGSRGNPPKNTRFLHMDTPDPVEILKDTTGNGGLIEVTKGLFSGIRW